MRQRVLVVEDEPTLRLAARRVLEESGAEVIAVEGVTEALAVLADHPLPILVLSDLHLLDGLGTTVLERARERGIERRVLTSADRRALREVDESLATDVLPKPFSRAVLLALMGVSNSGTGLRRPDLKSPTESSSESDAVSES